MSFTVGQLAKVTGLTVRALHHYDAIRLLSPSQRSEAGYRLYGQADIIKLFRIQALQRLGLSLAEIEGVLDRAGAALPALISRQVEALDKQIEQATTLRHRLSKLQLALAHGADPTADDWLDAVELITVYEQHCSPQELARLLDHKTDATQWRVLVDEVRAAVRDGIPARTARAGALVDRWAEMMLSSVGGDLDLALKVKIAYSTNPTLQARMAVQSGIDDEVMQYLGQAAFHKQLSLWRRHFEATDISRMQPDAPWNGRLVRVVSKLRAEKAARAAHPSPVLQRDWEDLLAHFAGADPVLQRKVIETLASDRDLQRCWLLEASDLEFMRRR